MANEKMCIGNSDFVSDSDVLKQLGYSEKEYLVANRRDGYSGGGGDDNFFVTVEKRNYQSEQREKKYLDGFDEDG